jgi:hypothetical protein
MAEPLWERLDPFAARWKKFCTGADADRVAAVEHSLTPELQRFIKEFDDVRTDLDGYVSALEKKYGVFETGDIGADASPDPKDAERHQALLALRVAYGETTSELEDRELTGEI